MRILSAAEPAAKPKRATGRQRNTTDVFEVQVPAAVADVLSPTWKLNDYVARTWSVLLGAAIASDEFRDGDQRFGFGQHEWKRGATSNNYLAVKSTFEERGWIKKVSNHLRGVRCTQYVLHPKFQNGETAPYRLLEPWRFKLQNDLDPSDRVPNWLAGHLPFFHVGPITVELDPWSNFSVRQIITGAMRISRDRFGRVHHNFSNLRTDVRRGLRLSGNPVVELDIANSQPFFAAMLAYRADQSPDVWRFLGMTERGEIYQFITDELSSQGYTPEQVWRPHWNERLKKAPMPSTLLAVVKHALITWLMYGPTAAERRPNPVRDLFRKHFPNVLDFIEAQKVKDYRNFSRSLQKMESEFVINRGCGELMRRSPRTRIVTIHDSAIIAPEDVELVKECWLKPFGKHRPLLRVK